MFGRLSISYYSPNSRAWYLGSSWIGRVVDQHYIWMVGFFRKSMAKPCGCNYPIPANLIQSTWYRFIDINMESRILISSSTVSASSVPDLLRIISICSGFQDLDWNIDSTRSLPQRKNICIGSVSVDLLSSSSYRSSKRIDLTKSACSLSHLSTMIREESLVASSHILTLCLADARSANHYDLKVVWNSKLNFKYKFESYHFFIRKWMTISNTKTYAETL